MLDGRLWLFKMCWNCLFRCFGHFGFLTVELPQNRSNSKDDYDSQFDNNDGKVSLRSAVINATVLDPVLIFPTVVPFVEFLNVALQLVSAEGNPSIVAIISDLESVGFVFPLVHLKNKIRGV